MKIINQKNNSKIITILLLIMLVILSQCKQHNQNKNDSVSPKKQVPHKQSTIQTKILKKGNYQFAFDLMTKQEHYKMMSQMGIKMKHNPKMTHALELTIIDKKLMQVIKNAKVQITLINPDKTKKIATAQEMKGAGMYHYVVDVLAKKGGIYKVSGKAEIGKKTILVNTFFMIK